MLAVPPKSVAIIGAGLSGLVLAVALHQYNIHCILYELRPSSTKAGGVISPNALRLLDRLGIYEDLKLKGYNFERIAFKNAEEVTTDLYYFGDEHLYGYQGLRVYRQVLLTELRNTATRLGIPIVYEKKFSHIVSESAEGVAFAFTDGSTRSADLLLGADGIHSSVRKYIVPNIVPKYMGVVAITCAARKAALQFPAGIDYHLPVSIHGKNGAFVIAPQDVDGGEILVGTQQAYPEQDRAGWDALFADKERLLSLFRTDMQDWPRIAQSALENIPTDTLSIWPFYVVPKLEHWYSPGKRVIILGDAAHAIPPSAGQGACQATEDSFTLATLLARLFSKVPLDDALDFWQRKRQDRVDQVIALTIQINNTRLPQAERETLADGQVWQSKEASALAWLYGAQVEDETIAWIESKNGGTPFERFLPS